MVVMVRFSLGEHLSVQVLVSLKNTNIWDLDNLIYVKCVNIKFLVSILCHHLVRFLLASRLCDEMWQNVFSPLMDNFTRGHMTWMKILECKGSGARKNHLKPSPRGVNVTFFHFNIIGCIHSNFVVNLLGLHLPWYPLMWSKD